jgi:hypothetical protein
MLDRLNSQHRQTNSNLDQQGRIRRPDRPVQTVSDEVAEIHAERVCQKIHEIRVPCPVLERVLEATEEDPQPLDATNLTFWARL